AALEAGRRFRLRGVEAMALVFEAEVYAYRLDRAAMEQTLDELARVSDDAFFQIVAWEGRGITSLLQEDRQRAVRDLENAAQVEATLDGVAPSPTLALWALNRPLDEPENSEARGLLRASSSMVNFCNAGFSAYAEAIALGRQGQGDAALAAAHTADQLLRPAAWF